MKIIKSSEFLAIITMKNKSLRNKLFAITTVVTIVAHSVASLATPTLKSEWRAQRSLIQVNELGKKSSAFLKEIQDTLLRMNDLSYNLVKGEGKYLDFAVNEQERLQEEGWMMKGFKGLEGRLSDFIDMSGLVAYHPEKNIIAIVYHGTAGNKDGWMTNLDGTQFEARKLLRELQRDLHAGVLAVLKAATDASDVTQLKGFLREFRPKQFDKARIAQFQTLTNQLANDRVIQPELAEDLQDLIRLKLEFMDYVESTKAFIKGRVHKGFTKKYYSTKKEVLGLVQHFLNMADAAGKKNDVSIVTSGHSQAGGTASQAVADLTANHGKELFGPDFNNRTSGNFSAYLLSAARVGDRDYVQWMHDAVGVDNIARQNVKGDPVPVASGDRDFAKLLREMLPGVGELLALMADYDDAGHLLLDDGDEAWRRAKELYAHEGLSVSDFDSIDDSVRYVASWLVNEKAVPSFIVGESPTKASWLFQPWAKFRTWIDTYRVIRIVKKAIAGDVKAQTKIADLIQQRYGHLHYGFYKQGLGASFDPRVVGRDIELMLQRGEEHQKAKRLQKEANKRALKEAKNASATPVKP